MLSELKTNALTEIVFIILLTLGLMGTFINYAEFLPGKPDLPLTAL